MMKTIIIKSEKSNKHFSHIYITLVMAFLFLNVNALNAQNSWIGGTPGAEHEWNNARNWSENKIPDLWDDMVIISDVSSQSGFYPIITKEVQPIAHLRLEGGAEVTILKEGKLIIDGSNTFNYGIYNVGNLINQGMVTIGNTGLSPFENAKQNIDNHGTIAFIDDSHMTTYLATN